MEFDFSTENNFHWNLIELFFSLSHADPTLFALAQFHSQGSTENFFAESLHNQFLENDLISSIFLTFLSRISQFVHVSQWITVHKTVYAQIFQLNSWMSQKMLRWTRSNRIENWILKLSLPLCWYNSNTHFFHWILIEFDQSWIYR